MFTSAVQLILRACVRICACACVRACVHFLSCINAMGINVVVPLRLS